MDEIKLHTYWLHNISLCKYLMLNNNKKLTKRNTQGRLEIAQVYSCYKNFQDQRVWNVTSLSNLQTKNRNVLFTHQIL